MTSYRVIDTDQAEYNARFDELYHQLRQRGLSRKFAYECAANETPRRIMYIYKGTSE